MAVVYSLRRSEVCGLRWNAIDFEDKKFLINRIVTEISAPYGTGKKEKIVVKDYPKSRRYKTYPLIKYVEEVLLNLRKKQMDQGTYKNDGYLLLNKKGELIRPNYITRQYIEKKENEF